MLYTLASANYSSGSGIERRERNLLIKQNIIVQSNRSKQQAYDRLSFVMCPVPLFSVIFKHFTTLNCIDLIY